MKRTLLLSCLVLLLLACGTLSPGSVHPTKTPLIRSQTGETGFVHVRLEKGRDSFLEAVRAELESAGRAGLTPFIEFDAVW